MNCVKSVIQEFDRCAFRILKMPFNTVIQVLNNCTGVAYFHIWPILERFLFDQSRGTVKMHSPDTLFPEIGVEAYTLSLFPEPYTPRITRLFLE
jgi:hypothetical protein